MRGTHIQWLHAAICRANESKRDKMAHTRKSFKGVVVEVGEEKDTVVVC